MGNGRRGGQGRGKGVGRNKGDNIRIWRRCERVERVKISNKNKWVGDNEELGIGTGGSQTRET